jgi:GrpB-like predicted nucleotidyltransferase (UPF0157 family)
MAPATARVRPAASRISANGLARFLRRSARLNPDLADRYAEVERRIGHRFRTDITMADVIAEALDAGQLALIPLADIA